MLLLLTFKNHMFQQETLDPKICAPRKFLHLRCPDQNIFLAFKTHSHWIKLTPLITIKCSLISPSHIFPRIPLDKADQQVVFQQTTRIHCSGHTSGCHWDHKTCKYNCPFVEEDIWHWVSKFYYVLSKQYWE